VSALGPILRCIDVRKEFGGVHAVRGVNLEVEYGERRALLGPNGAGKTTLFNAIAGDFEVTAGRIELFGGDVTYLPKRARTRLGMTRTYQISRLFAGLTVLDNLYLASLGVSKGHFSVLRRKKRDGEHLDHARAVAERVGLTPTLGALVGALSHGEQRQLEVGMALAGKPQLMLLDEPAAGLSPAERIGLADLLLRLEPEITLILIEHDMDIALRVAERVTMMHDGSVVVEGTPAEIRANELVHDLYLGRSHGE
jgi:branched-chain amino acid transport system ATP-binding protein